MAVEGIFLELADFEGMSTDSNDMLSDEDWVVVRVYLQLFGLVLSLLEVAATINICIAAGSR